MSAVGQVICTWVTFGRETSASGGSVGVVSVGERGQFRVEVQRAAQMPMILSALRLTEEDEARAVRALNTGEAVTVQGWTCVGDLLCVGFGVREGELGRLRAA